MWPEMWPFFAQGVCQSELAKTGHPGTEQEVFDRQNIDFDGSIIRKRQDLELRTCWFEWHLVRKSHPHALS